MRFYITYIEEEKKQRIVNLDFGKRNYGAVIDPSKLNGKTITNAHEDKVGDIIIETD